MFKKYQAVVESKVFDFFFIYPQCRTNSSGKYRGWLWGEAELGLASHLIYIC